MPHALLRLGPQKVAEDAARNPNMTDPARAAIIATRINAYVRYHELGIRKLP